MTEYFIDCHSHLFNIEDIPLYPTIANVNNLPNTLLAFGALFGVHKKKLEEYKPFIDYFDKRKRDNVIWLCEQIENTLAGYNALSNRQIILTPLVMDFDLVGNDAAHSFEDVIYQTNVLRNEIKLANLNGQKTKILPFVGLDLRKVVSCSDARTFLENIFDEVGGIKKPNAVNGIDELQSGDIIGIKLYPPIGFNPYGDVGQSSMSNKLKDFYSLCIERGIPVTVHCQSGSYSGYDENIKMVDEYTHPRNWEKVLKEIDGERLRINFAHFGGEDEITNCILPPVYTPEDHIQGGADPLNEIKKDSWNGTLLRLLKLYPHTFADISAFDYSNSDAILGLCMLLSLDESNLLDKRLGIDQQPVKLKDKLLWGSDIPMILGKETKKKFNMEKIETYSHYFKFFYTAMKIDSIRSGTYKTPKELGYSIPSADDLINRITYKNPMKFLFGFDGL